MVVRDFTVERDCMVFGDLTVRRGHVVEGEGSQLRCRTRGSKSCAGIVINKQAGLISLIALIE